MKNTNCHTILDDANTNSSESLYSNKATDISSLDDFFIDFKSNSKITLSNIIGYRIENITNNSCNSKLANRLDSSSTYISNNYNKSSSHI